jgi:hypothetical protein
MQWRGEERLVHVSPKLVGRTQWVRIPTGERRPCRYQAGVIEALHVSMGGRRTENVVPRWEVLSKEVEVAFSRAQESEERDLGMITSEYAARGLARSGAVIQAHHERRVCTLRALLDVRLRMERETPLAPEDEDAWYRELVASVDGIMERETARLLDALDKDSARFGGGGPLPPSWRNQIIDDLQKIREQYLKESEIVRDRLALEAQVPKPAPAASITLNVSQSQIANLNLGTMIGNIQNAVGGLQEKGLQQLAGAIKELAEAVVDEAALTDKAKQEAVETISVIGEEAAKPEPQRRLGILRLAGSALWELVKNVDKLQTAYNTVKEILKANGINLGV